MGERSSDECSRRLAPKSKGVKNFAHEAVMQAWVDTQDAKGATVTLATMVSKGSRIARLLQSPLEDQKSQSAGPRSFLSATASLTAISMGKLRASTQQAF